MGVSFRLFEYIWSYNEKDLYNHLIFTDTFGNVLYDLRAKQR